MSRHGARDGGGCRGGLFLRTGRSWWVRPHAIVGNLEGSGASDMKRTRRKWRKRLC